MSNWSRWQTPLGLLLCAAISTGPAVPVVGQAVLSAVQAIANAGHVVADAREVVDGDLHAHPDPYERLVWSNASYSATGQAGPSYPYFA